MQKWDVYIAWGIFLNQIRLFVDDFYELFKYTTYFYTRTQLEKYLQGNEHKVSAHRVLSVTQVVLPSLIFNKNGTC